MLLNSESVNSLSAGSVTNELSHLKLQALMFLIWILRSKSQKLHAAGISTLFVNGLHASTGSARAMRISPNQVHLITQSVHFYLGDSARIWLFGSRLDDQKRGGDVDLYVEAEAYTLMDEIHCKIQLEQRLDMPVDLIVRPKNENAPIARIAKNTGLRL